MCVFLDHRRQPVQWQIIRVGAQWVFYFFRQPLESEENIKYGARADRMSRVTRMVKEAVFQPSAK